MLRKQTSWQLTWLIHLYALRFLLSKVRAVRRKFLPPLETSSSGIMVVASLLAPFISLLAIFGLTRESAVTKRQATTVLSSEEIEAFQPYTLYASIAYCDPSQTLSWSCGGLCLSRLRSGIGVDLHDYQISASAPPPFNLLLLVVTGRMSSSVSGIIVFLNYHLQT